MGPAARRPLTAFGPSTARTAAYRRRTGPLASRSPSPRRGPGARRSSGPTMAGHCWSRGAGGPAVDERRDVGRETVRGDPDRRHGRTARPPPCAGEVTRTRSGRTNVVATRLPFQTSHWRSRRSLRRGRRECPPEGGPKPGASSAMTGGRSDPGLRLDRLDAPRTGRPSAAAAAAARRAGAATRASLADSGSGLHRDARIHDCRRQRSARRQGLRRRVHARPRRGGRGRRRGLPLALLAGAVKNTRRKTVGAEHGADAWARSSRRRRPGSGSGRFVVDAVSPVPRSCRKTSLTPLVSSGRAWSALRREGDEAAVTGQGGIAAVAAGQPRLRRSRR